MTKVVYQIQERFRTKARLSKQDSPAHTIIQIWRRRANNPSKACVVTMVEDLQHPTWIVHWLTQHLYTATNRPIAKINNTHLGGVYALTDKWQ